MELSLYRKYRPQTFADVVGQDHVSRTLQNALAADTVAHAYVFAGPRGIGKTSMAKILAMALNCPDVVVDHEADPGPAVTPCGRCQSCTMIAASTSLDVIEMDAASNRGIDDIRELREKVGFAPVQGRMKVYIVDEAHMLTKEAFNALLKTLEEPPPHVVFVLATTEPHRIPETILSRCQRFDFRRPRVQEIALLLAHIAAGEQPPIDIDEPAVLEIARHAEGSFRDAIGTLEKLATYFAGESITSQQVLEILGVIESDVLFDIVDIVIERDAAGALLFVQRLAERGVSVPQFIHDLLRHLRQIFLLQHLEDLAEDATALRALSQSLEIDDSLLDRLQRQAHQFAPRELLRFVELLGDAQTEIRAGLDARLQLELALVKVARPELDLGPEALEERLRRLEAGGAPVAAAKTAAKVPAPKAATPKAGPEPAPKPKAEPAPQPAAVETAPEPVAEPQPEAAADEPEAAADEAEDKSAAEPDEADIGSAEEPGDDDTMTEVFDEPETEPTAADEGAAAAPAAAAPVMPDACSDEPPAERTCRAWDLVLEQVRTRDFPLYAVLKDAHPAATADDRLTVAMPSEIAFAKVNDPAGHALLTAVVRAATGCEPQIEFTLGRTGPSEAEDAPAHDVSLDTAQAIAFLQHELGAVELPDDE
jgi:DNA polymerase-3 subunit gamma/tau